MTPARKLDAMTLTALMESSSVEGSTVLWRTHAYAFMEARDVVDKRRAGKDKVGDVFKTCR